MIDDTSVYMFGYSTTTDIAFPGPTIVCQEGDTVAITLTNQIDTTGAFVVGGTSINQTVAPGATNTFSFPAPATAGSQYP